MAATVVVQALVLVALVATGAAQLNRAPHFLSGGDMARFALPEDTEVGAPVYRLRGTDPEGGHVRYSISGDWLAVERESGVVTLRRPLDRESTDIFEVIISVTDEGTDGAESNTVSLRREVAVLDVNDNAPEFLGRPYGVSLSETAPVGSTVYANISVADADGGVNADVTVTCAPDSDANADDGACDTFDVVSEKLSEDLFSVRLVLRRALDFERRAAFRVGLLAEDGAADPRRRLHARAAVRVDVVDAQDQPPAFIGAPFSASVAEGTPPGVRVLTVRARDGDEGAARPVLLALEGERLGCFRLAPRATEGSVAVADLLTAAPLDREHPDVLLAGGIYTFSVRATELINNELPGDTATSQVTIIVTDVDDQMPTFNQRNFHINVSEDIGADSPLPGLALVAVDGDVGENARFGLRLRAGPRAEGAFAVAPTSATGRAPIVLKVADPERLDFDVEDPADRRLDVEVVAVVMGPDGEEIEADAAHVEVTLLDANDHAPAWPQAAFRVRVREDTAPGAPLATFVASDVDSGAFGRVSYALRGFGAETFVLHPDTGKLFLANGSQGLDFERRSSYSLTLEARDGGGRASAADLFVEVEDVNDNAPAFELREYTRTVREGATAFEPQLYVRATDGDGPEQGGGKVFYSITSSNSDSSVLFVEPISGEVKLNSPARAADTSRGQYEITVKATDAGSPPLSSETRVLVRVGVQGNQRPIFRGNHNVINAPSSYVAAVKENAPAGTEVVQVTASDPDGQDSLLQYFIISGARDNFAINHSSGLITVAPEANLDLEAGIQQYNVIVHAVDAGTPIPETATSTVTVNIIDVNNKAPKFVSSDPLMYVKYISEATPVGKVIMNVTAHDPDTDANLRYKMVEPIRAADRTGVALKSTVPFDFKTAFAINETTGQLSVARQLEHAAAAAIVLTVQVEDLNALEGKQLSTVEVTVHIQANDENKPIFTIGGWTPSNPVIHVSVPEERPMGTTLLTLVAQDPLGNVPITQFKQLRPNEVDASDFVTINIQSGDVVLNRRLDYENLPEKRITISVSAIAKDLRSSDAVILIDVEDINDNSPTFTQEAYSAQIPESTKYPTVILTVAATDEDFVNNATGYGTIRYTLSGENGRLFVINKTTGEISVAPNVTLDHERYTSHKFSVIATDTPQGGANQRKTTTEVLVEVLDINDNAPAFAQEAYTAVVPENVPIDTGVITVTASDPDEGLGGEVTYELLDEGEANGLFKVNKSSGRITTRKQLTGKGRSEPFKMVLRAQDSGDPVLSTDVPLDVYIGDVFINDGVPTFIRPTLSDIAQISENSSIGSPVFQVVATDPDDPNTPNGKITYKFVADGTDASVFAIDPESGLISTKKLLDREERENYTLIVVAEDQGSPPQQTSRLLNVHVLDVDDHTPLFHRGLDDEPITMTLEEEVDLGTNVGIVEAFDKDDGENALIDYLIIYGNEEGFFDIRRTDDNRGLISVAKRIDREAINEHLLTVKCFKKALRPSSLRKHYNRQDPSEIQVAITVEDIDDNKPIFVEDNITIGVRLNVPVDTSLLMLETEDADDLPAPVMYYLLNTTFNSLAVSVMDIVSIPADHEGTFRLNNRTGELRTAGSMLPYVDGYFDLTILATNTNNSDMDAYASVKVFVLRDRDLLKFVFNKPPSDVRRDILNFQREVEQALLLPVTLNIYDTQFYAKEDGSLDFSSTSSCFQLVGRESYDLKDMESLTQDETNEELGKVYKKYGVQTVEHCAPLIATAEASWVQLWVLAIAAFIGIGAFLAGISTCCLYSRYKRMAKRALLQDMPRGTISNVGYMTNSVGNPSMIITPPSVHMEGPRMYDGLTISTNHDNMSYHSFPAR